MANDILDRTEQILAEAAQRLNNVAREHELFAEGMRKLSASPDRLEASQAKTDEMQKETAKQQKKTEKGIDCLSKEIGGGLGRAAEGLTAPCVPKVFKKLGITVETVHQRVKVLHNGQVKAEIDLLCPAKRNGCSYSHLLTQAFGVKRVSNRTICVKLPVILQKPVNTLKTKIFLALGNPLIIKVLVNQ